MVSTEPSMAEQHTCSAAALPEGAFLPAGPQCPAPDAIRKAAPQDLQALFSTPVRL